MHATTLSITITRIFFYTHTLTLILQTILSTFHIWMIYMYWGMYTNYKGVPFILPKLFIHSSELRVVQNRGSLVMIYKKFLHQPKSLDISTASRPKTTPMSNSVWLKYLTAQLIYNDFGTSWCKWQFDLVAYSQEDDRRESVIEVSSLFNHIVASSNAHY